MASIHRERRKRERVALQCPIRIIASPGGQVGDAIVVNISCQGIYCLSQFPFTPGEQLRCAISISPNGFQPEDVPLSLQCELRVVRVEETSAGFGMGCRIEEYALARVHRGQTSEDDLQMLCEQKACSA